MIGQIYPSELHLNEAKSSYTKAPFLDSFVGVIINSTEIVLYFLLFFSLNALWEQLEIVHRLCYIFCFCH